AARGARPDHRAGADPRHRRHGARGQHGGDPGRAARAPDPAAHSPGGGAGARPGLVARTERDAVGRSRTARPLDRGERKLSRNGFNRDSIMSTLGSVADLPADYYNGLVSHNLLPLWPSLRSLLPYGKPARSTRPTLWRYADIRPNLLRAGELAPIEK